MIIDGKEAHRDFEISLTCGMMGFDIGDDFSFESFTDLELETVFYKNNNIQLKMFKEMKSRGLINGKTT